MTSKAEKACSRCGVVKPMDEYTPDKRRNDGHAARCKICCATDKRDNRAQQWAQLKFKRRRAWSGVMGNHEIIVIEGEFADCLLIVNGKPIGYVKPDYMEDAIKDATEFQQ